jgi:hypothetical protein
MSPHEHRRVGTPGLASSMGSLVIAVVGCGPAPLQIGNVDYGVAILDEVGAQPAIRGYVNVHPNEGTFTGDPALRAWMRVAGPYGGATVDERHELGGPGVLATEAFWAIRLNCAGVYDTDDTVLSCFDDPGGTSTWPVRFELTDLDDQLIDCGYAHIAPDDTDGLDGCREVEFLDTYIESVTPESVER